MNKKGFAISIVLYSIVLLLISIFYMLLGIVKSRYVVSSKLREEIMESMNNSKVANVLERRIVASSCNPVWVDDMGTTSTSDDIKYLSGTNDCVNFNYVWYSGKLWRIVAIYPDGAVKMITENNITSISWGSTVEYNGSWVYQWLNEDFYDTLYNASGIIENGTWNYSMDGNSTPVRPETINGQKTKIAPVGLLSAYEYYNAYRNSSGSNNYLTTGYYWVLITPYSSSSVYCTNSSGFLRDFTPSEKAYGIRPSIKLKSSVKFTGNGTKTSPYKIVGDKEEAVNNTTLLSSRTIGEYVNFDNALYRIVGIDNGITKLTRVDLLRDSGMVIGKKFASSAYYGKSSNTKSVDYWDYYLNNNWYNGISTTYKNMLVDGTYYLGIYPYNSNYKVTICKNANLDNIAVKNCTKYTSSDADKTFIGKVGLPRTGEMFSALPGKGYSPASMWIITPFNGNSSVHYIYFTDTMNNYVPSAVSYGVRPSINLKSGVKIKSGAGTESDPYVVGL